MPLGGRSARGNMRFSKSFNISIVCVCGAKLDGYLSDEGERDFVVIVDNNHICPAAQHTLAVDEAGVCRVDRHVFVDGVCAQCGVTVASLTTKA